MVRLFVLDGPFSTLGVYGLGFGEQGLGLEGWVLASRVYGLSFRIRLGLVVHI